MTVLTLAAALVAVVESNVIGLTNVTVSAAAPADDVPRLEKMCGPNGFPWPLEFRPPKPDRGPGYPEDIARRREEMRFYMQLQRLQRRIDWRVKLRDDVRWTVSHAVSTYVEDDDLVAKITDEVLERLYPTNVIARRDLPASEPSGKCVLCGTKLPRRLLSDDICPICEARIREGSW